MFLDNINLKKSAWQDLEKKLFEKSKRKIIYLNKQSIK